MEEIIEVEIVEGGGEEKGIMDKLNIKKVENGKGGEILDERIGN